MTKDNVGTAPGTTASVFDEGVAYGSVGNVFVGVCRQPGTIPRMADTATRLRRMIAQHAAGIAQLWVFEPTALTTVNGDVRNKGAEMSQEFGPSTLALAYVLEGDGFRAAAARMALSAIRLVSRTEHPSAIFSSVEEGARWLRKEVPAVDEKRVVALLEKVRALLPPPV